jgi:DNA-binding CsgD family transcriptional regulator
MDIEESDMRVIVRLLGETAALPGGLMDKKLYLLDGLCDIAGAHEWAWALSSVQDSDSSFFLRRKIGERFDIPLELPESSGAPGSLESVPNHAPSHLICCSRSVSADTTSQIRLLRDRKEPAYSKREIHLASLVLEEIPWLHWREWKNMQPSHQRLSPRLQLTLDLLLLGLGRKDIADQIGISDGTVGGYIRDLYRHFGVNSQAELMRLRVQHPSLPKTP